MAYTGGDIIDMIFVYKTLGTKRFSPKSGEGSTYDYGGARTKSDKTARDGSGQMMRTMNNNLASFKAKLGWDMTDREDLQNLTDMSNTTELFTSGTFTNINGETHVMTNGCPVGDLTGDGNDIVIDVEFQGETLKKLS
jgi:hypothetical protein